MRWANDQHHHDIQSNDTQNIVLFATFSITQYTQHNKILSIVMLSVVMVSVVMLSVIMVSVIMLSVVMLSVIMLSHYAK